LKKISEYRDAEALDMLAEIIEPAIVIMGDKNVADLIMANKLIPAIKEMIKAHKTEVMQILAAMEGVPFEEFHCNVFTLPMRVLELLNDEALLSFFTSQAPETSQKTFSGPVMGDTTGNEV